MKAKTIDKKFDDNKEDMLDAFDLSKARKPNQEQKRVNVDFPTWMISDVSSNMEIHHLKFNGAIIKRGFWLYVCQVTHGNAKVLYVGRTGDSSSKNAASPFNRLCQHLNIRPNAKANTLLKNIKAQGFNPAECEYELTTIGPLFPEQETLEEHRKCRDEIASQEAALADFLREKGRTVIGSHPKSKPKNEQLFSKIKSMIEGQF